MKYGLIYITALLVCFQLYSQQQSHEQLKIKTLSGIITYSFTANNFTENLSKDKSERIMQVYKKMDFGALFNFKFNNNSSFFEIEKKMGNDYNPIGHKLTNMTLLGGSYYTNLTENILTKKVEVGGEKFLVELKPVLYSKWEITDEIKKIKGYTCYKAIGVKKISNSRGDFEFGIEAWFTPQIPTRLGLKEFNNLPGLILELKDTHHTFHVEKIKLFHDKEIEIKPFSGETITEEEYHKILTEKSFFYGRN